MQFLVERQRNINVLQVFVFGALVKDVNISSDRVIITRNAIPTELLSIAFGCTVDTKQMKVQTSQIGDFVHIRAPVLTADDMGINYRDVLLQTETFPVEHLYCSRCGLQLTSHGFSKTLPLPSKNWRDIADLWTCEVDHFQEFERDEIGGVHGKCLVAASGLLVHSDDITSGVLRLEGPCGDLRLVQCVGCATVLGRAYLDQSVGTPVRCVLFLSDRCVFVESFPETFTMRIARHRVSSTATAQDPLNRFRYDYICWVCRRFLADSVMQFGYDRNAHCA